MLSLLGWQNDNHELPFRKVRLAKSRPFVWVNSEVDHAIIIFTFHLPSPQVIHLSSANQQLHQDQYPSFASKEGSCHHSGIFLNLSSSGQDQRQHI